MKAKLKFYDNSRFDDIINLPHHVSSKHPAMSAMNRAAQFAPFAALTGYDTAVNETARLTSDRIELDEEAKQRLNERMCIIQEKIMDRPEIEVTYFVPDARKQGGEYVTKNINVKKIDTYKRQIISTQGFIIPIDEIMDIDAEMFIDEDIIQEDNGYEI